MISASTYMMTGSGTLNPTIRANRQVVVRQYTRGLRIALEFNDVLVSVVRGHELGLRAAAEATNVLNCLDVHCEIPFCGGHAELGTDQRRDHVLRGGEEGERGGGFVGTLVLWGVGGIGELVESEDDITQRFYVFDISEWWSFEIGK